MGFFPQLSFGRILGIGLLLVGAGFAAFTFLPKLRQYAGDLFTEQVKAETVTYHKIAPAELIVSENGDYGLKLSKEAIESLELKPTEAVLAHKMLPLPPVIGALNYDNDRLFAVRPRFPGELAEILQVDYTEYPQGPTKKRPLRFGDRVQQGETLAVLWCRDMGEKKAALVDAISNLRLSENALERKKKSLEMGALSLESYKLAERQLQLDSNVALTAERTLKIWKLTDQEIQIIKDQAKGIVDQKLNRDPDSEKNWARVEVKAPKFSDDPNKKLVVVEKNTSLNDMVDPSRDTPLFRLADLCRLQIWVHPPEEYLPLLRERLKEGLGSLKWEIRFQSDPPNTPARLLDVAMLSPSLTPTQQTPMLIGYLDNPDGKYLIGQFVTATIRVPSPVDEQKKPTTVEIPTDALNYIKGQNLVFVRNPTTQNEFMLRRVAVVQSSKHSTLVRLKLTSEDQEISSAEVKKGHYKIQELLPGEQVITRGVVELTDALEELRSQLK